ncbi:hypothetical protein BFP76_00345 [Amylibacter kogurei]|uniref:Type I restriction modification DNA specificity domain-containing protein n=1 Tax=Paramylibacter kogurei TaxID=1889778 RepID=A0A2G5K856_9RHOB|nr:restriction endonuclease subunit S [Amylibacter kogurei]PIB25625.1 hypothetical protein BFP76_00345 [Amylibacter kogurei]
MSVADIVPVLRFPEFSGDWEGIRLGEIVSQSYQGVNTAADQVQYVSSGAPIIQAKHITSGELDFSEARSIGSADYKTYCSKFNPVLNDILVSNIGTLGKVIIVNEDQKFLIAWNIFLVRLAAEQTFPRFVFHVLKNTASGGYFERMKSGNATKFVNKTDMLAIRFGLPSLPEQKKIAAFLGVVDAKFAGLKARQEGLERYKRGLMQALFSQRLRFTKSDGTAFPDWEEKRLGDVLSVEMGQSPSSSSYNDQKEGLPLIQGNADVKFRLSAPRRYTSEITKICEIDDILLSVRAPVGETSKAIHRACIGRGIAALRANKPQHQEFWHQFLLRYEPKWAALEQGSTFAAISGPDIRSLKVKAPHPDEQQKIADALSAMDAKIAAVAGQVAKMQEFKKGLLQQMFV